MSDCGRAGRLAGTSCVPSRRITIEPGKRVGQPTIRGLQITVYDVLRQLANAPARFSRIYRSLNARTSGACLAFAADREHRKVALIAQ